MTLRETLLGGSSGLILFDALFNSMEALLAVSDLLFSLTVVMNGTLASQIPWLDQSLMTKLLLFAALLYATNLLINIYERLNDET